MKIIEYGIKEITPYKMNTKVHDDTQISNVAKSIEKYGFVQPIVIDHAGVIIIGHCRYAAAKALGLKTVPCVRMDDLTEEQANMLRIVDNKTNESPWDMERLDQEMKHLQGEFDEFDLYFDFSGLMDDKPDPEPEPKTDKPEPEPIEPGCIECPRCGNVYMEDEE